MAASNVCAVHLGPNGLTHTTTDQALVKFKQEELLKMSGTLVLDSAGKRQAYERLSTSRFTRTTE